MQTSVSSIIRAALKDMDEKKQLCLCNKPVGTNWVDTFGYLSTAK